MKQKLVTLLLALCCLFGLGAFSACGGDKKDSSSKPQSWVESSIKESNEESSSEIEENSSISEEESSSEENSSETEESSDSEESSDGEETHTHSFAVDKDKIYHWTACDCGTTTEQVAHNFVEQKDCDYHWTACDCGAITEKVVHVYTDGQCICGTKIQPSEGLEYTLSDDKTYYSVSRGTAIGKKIIISATYNNLPVKSIEAKAFYNRSSLTEITIPDSVTSIEHEAFSGCSSLTGVYITDIAAWCAIDFGSNPLYYAKNLYLNNELVTKLEIPNGVTTIKNYAFSGCSSLISVTIGNNVTTIVDSAFSGCSSLTSITVDEKNPKYASQDGILYNKYKTNFIYVPQKITGKVVIPNNITSIGYWAFSGRSSLTEIVIPDSVTSIEHEAFYGCSSLTEITIPDSVTFIGDSAFSYCSSLTSVTIGNSVKTIEREAFSYCSSLTGVYITDIAAWCAIDFGLYNSNSNPLYYDGLLYLNNELVTKLEIPNGVTTIKNYAFRGCSSLTEIVIPDSVTSIGNFAFSVCSSLTEIVIPDSVTSIGNFAFSVCSSLTEIVIPDSVTTIGEYAFSGCSSLTEITIPDSVTTIGRSAFYDCYRLTSVTIGNGVTSIGVYAFEDCSSLTSVTFENTTSWTVNYIDGNKTVSISSTDLADTSTAAKYLTDTYSSYNWNRSDE